MQRAAECAARYLRPIAYDANVPTLLDSIGDTLELGLSASPTRVKPNQHELAHLLKRELKAMDDYVEAVRDPKQHLPDVFSTEWVCTNEQGFKVLHRAFDRQFALVNALQDDTGKWQTYHPSRQREAEFSWKCGIDIPVSL